MSESLHEYQPKGSHQEQCSFSSEEVGIADVRPIVQYESGEIEPSEDVIAVEFPLTIFVNGEEFATMVCTPDHLEELVTGFLASEGVILLPREIESLTINEEKGIARVETAKKRPLNKERYSKRFIGSCCGKSRQFYLQNDARTAKTIMTHTNFTAAQCIGLMEKMQDTAESFRETGGVHTAALATAEEIVLSRVDIGRHNALDKIYGYCLQNRISLKDKAIVFSGRISSEVLLKAAKIGIGIVLSKSAPTTLAINLAEDLGITAVGFIRENRLNVYSHPGRIIN